MKSQLQNKIYNYWFKKDAGFEKWFSKSKSYDEEISRDFKIHLNSHLSIQKDEWGKSKKAFLSYIILTDQFPRHIYRNSARSYSYDKYSLKFMKKYILLHLFTLNPYETMFALMPLQHSEKLNDQLLGIGLLQFSLKYIHPQNKTLKEALKHQKGHYKLIQKFGRLPKRNPHLKRVSTVHELAYLSSKTHANHY